MSILLRTTYKFNAIHINIGTCPMAKPVENLPARQETQEMQVRSLDQEDFLKEGMVPHASILPWESHGLRSLLGYSPKGCKGSDMTMHTCTTKIPMAFFFLQKQKKNPKFIWNHRRQNSQGGHEEEKQSWQHHISWFQNIWQIYNN